MNDQDSTIPSSKKPPPPHFKQILSSTGSSSPVLVSAPHSLDGTEVEERADNMDENADTNKAVALNSKTETPPPPPPTATVTDTGEKDAKASLSGKKKSKGQAERKVEKKVKKKGKKGKKKETSEHEESSEDSSSDQDSSDDEKERRRRKKRAAARAVEKKKAAKSKEKTKAKKGKKSKKPDSSDNSDFSDSEVESESDSESSEDEKAKRKRKTKSKLKKKPSKKYDSTSSNSSSSSSSSSSSDNTSSEDEKAKRKRSKRKTKHAKVKAVETSTSTDAEGSAAETASAIHDDINAQIAALQLQKQQLAAATAAAATLQTQADAVVTTTDKTKKGKKNALEFKRVDQVWDSKIRDYKYMESVEEQKDDFDSVFTVRRKFGWDNKYLATHVDIKSKLLRNVLQVIFKDRKSISLVEDKPSIQPNMLYHYYKEITTYVKKTLKPQLRHTKKRKEKKQLEQKIAQCKLLLQYIDEDYTETRKTLKPMLQAGTITYNLVWALFKPNSIAYTPTYGNKDDPRCFKVDYCYEEEDWFGNKKWNIEGRYLEYNGKVFGLGDYFTQIAAFKGPRKIASLGAYPLAFYKDPEMLREQLIERGKKFVALQGMNYRFQKGLAYMKVKRVVLKFNINGRVMVDPGLFRRMNANYPLSYIKTDELGQDQDDSDNDSDEEGCGCGDDSDSDGDADDEDEKPAKGRVVMWKDSSGQKYLIRLPAAEKGPDITAQKLDSVSDSEDSESESFKHVFSEEELLIASPVVLGFSFSEKAWVEFSLAGIKDIEWNDEAFDTLVLPSQIKQNLKGLVSSHRFDAAKTIDDVIVGKGKGLNVVLHGPPGVGKTLTGESIAEYLRCPLYAVSSGELGTNAGQLERDLNRIMDITHSWGAILLLDEADVFLEARQPHDIHRNALVSVFLRLTEYYQGILFLTTNRVSTFDEAFQSRIHMGIRYENLTTKARKKIWQHHVGKVIAMCSTPSSDHKATKFEEEQYDELSRKVMNGRQIKNAVKTSQAIAVAEKGVFSMDYVKRVMDAHEIFEEDMKGGRGYRDAMRQYT